jgi:hypothetical protein
VRVGIDIFAGDPYAGRRVQSHANSAACFQLIAHWMTVCLTEHTHCQRAVCSYSWTEDIDEWARSPSYTSRSSDSEHSDGLPVVESPEKSCPDAVESEISLKHEADEGELYAASPKRHKPMSPKQFDGLENEDDELEIYEASGTQILSGRPPNQARLCSPRPATSSNSSSEVFSRSFGPDLAVEASNLQKLREATAAQLIHTRLLSGRSPLSRGILNRTVHAPRRAKANGSIDDGGYKLYFRSEELLDLQENSWKYNNVDIRPAPLLPTRYIYVDCNPPKLCIADPDARGFYIALSHCWGKARPLVTTTDALADHQKGIPLKDMPQTFQDAVTITRELGIEYLWIDSLCILQDSKEDWEKESAKMANIYGNAFLTISASASESSEQGIFRPRTVPPGPPVELRCNDSDFEPIYIDYKLENTPFQEPQSTDSRAWCFQEMALSPRVLVYGKEMLGWLCDSVTDVEHGYVVEHYEDPNPPLLAPRLNPMPAKNPLEKFGYPFTLYHYASERERAVGRWASMVNAFTKRKLTHENDRLPALSGIVKEIQLQTGDEYLAGLWRRELSHDLLWEVDCLFAAKDSTWHRPTKYRAPSWSWAAIEGPIRMDLRPSEFDKAYGDVLATADDVRVLEAKVEPIGQNPYGEVSGGYLKLSTRMWKVVLRPFQNSKSINPKYWLRPDKWIDSRIMHRQRQVHTPEGKSIGLCVLDMPDERDWDVTELWWVKVDVRGSGVLVMKDCKGDAFVRVGVVSGLDGIYVPETEIVDIFLV